MVETWNETWWHRNVLCVFCATHCWNFLWRHISIGSQILEALIRELCERAQATVLTMRFPVLHHGHWQSAQEDELICWHCCTNQQLVMHERSKSDLQHSGTAMQHSMWAEGAADLCCSKGVSSLLSHSSFPFFSLCVCSMQELRFRSSWEISCANLMFWSFKEMNYFKSPCLEWKWRCPRCRKKFVIIL